MAIASAVVHRERPLPVEPIAKGLAFHERHHVEELAPGLARIEERKDVGVLQGGGGADLGVESRGADLRADVGAKDLDGDAAVVAEVVGEVDRGHAASADLALDAVAGAQFFEHG